MSDTHGHSQTPPPASAAADPGEQPPAKAGGVWAAVKRLLRRLAGRPRLPWRR